MNRRLMRQFGLKPTSLSGPLKTLFSKAVPGKSSVGGGLLEDYIVKSKDHFMTTDGIRVAVVDSKYLDTQGGGGLGVGSITAVTSSFKSRKLRIPFVVLSRMLLNDPRFSQEERSAVIRHELLQVRETIRSGDLNEQKAHETANSQQPPREIFLRRQAALKLFRYRTFPLGIRTLKAYEKMIEKRKGDA